MKSLHNYMEAKQTALFDECGVFFAFSKEQLKDGMEKVGASPENKICEIGAGGFVLAKNFKKFLDQHDKILNDAIDQDVKENGAEAIIRREYFNYEQQIAWDDLNFMDEMKLYQERYPEKFSKTVIKRVRQECWKEAVKNDWF